MARGVELEDAVAQGQEFVTGAQIWVAPRSFAHNHIYKGEIGKPRRPCLIEGTLNAAHKAAACPPVTVASSMSEGPI